jgi:tRNA (adenine22-N1)-methyltransferase
MNSQKTRLSERLHLVYEHLISHQDVWDVCCDHGYLGGAAYNSENFKNIYFVDQVPALIENIKTKFDKFIFNELNKSQVFFIIESGQNIQTNVFGSVSITGVGAQVIYQILYGLLERKILKAQRLILGPHRDTEKLMGLIQANPLFADYQLTARKEMTENGRLRVFFIYDLSCV